MTDAFATPPVPPRPGLSPAQRLVLAATSVLGLGYAPVAPGTFGTVAALPVWYALAALPVPHYLAVVVGVVLASIYLSARAEEIYGAHDVQRIVLDEVAGMLCAVVAVPLTAATLPAAFITFRLLDATKPGPIGWVDRNVGGGLGVVLDDVAAGLVTLAACHGAHAAGFLPW